MSQSTIEVTLFDVGNVIVRATHKITEAILWELGVRPDKAALFFHGKHYGDFARGKITDVAFAKAIYDALELPQLTLEFIRVAHDAHLYAVDWDVVTTTRAMKACGVPIAFVTTTNEWQTARERKLIDLEDPERPLGPVVRSHEIHMTKTDDGAWPVILRELGWQDRDPSSILLVDDAKGNCEAARRAGLTVHQYDPTPDVGVTALRRALVGFGLLE